MHRRTLLSSLTAVGTVAIAGCSGNVDLESLADGNGAEPASDGNTDQSGPEAAVEQYRTGVFEGDAEMVNEVIYEDGRIPKYEDEDLEPLDIEVQSQDITEISIEEWASQTGRDTLSEEEVAEFKEDSLSESGGTKLAIVRWREEFVTEQGSEGDLDDYVFLHKIDGEWLIVNTTFRTQSQRSENNDNINIEIATAMSGDVNTSIVVNEVGPVTGGDSISFNPDSLNPNAVTQISGVLTVTPQGSGTYDISADADAGPVTFTVSDGTGVSGGSEVNVDMSVDLTGDVTVDDIPSDGSVSIIVEESS